MTKPTYRLTVERQEALKRALENIAAGRTPREVGPEVYLVPSAHADWSYEVKVESLREARATCTCRHGITPDARGVCWHKIAALLAAGRKARVPVPVPGPSQAKRRLSDGEVASRMRQLFSR